MGPWVLVVLLFPQPSKDVTGVPTSIQVPGFQTEALCMSAGEEVISRAKVPWQQIATSLVCLDQG